MLFEPLLAADGRLFVVSGPSGVGKDTVLDTLFEPEIVPNGLIRCVTATTRAPRPHEIHARDYFFFTPDEFRDRLDRHFFLEHAIYNNDYYGTPGDFVATERSAGRDVLLKIEVQGALQVRRSLPEAILIFLAPPSWEELERRLRSRATDDEAKVLRRLEIARSEMHHAPEYDYLVVNADVNAAAQTLRAIIQAERCRVVKTPVSTKSTREATPTH